jgi:hypothetical protein
MTLKVVVLGLGSSRATAETMSSTSSHHSSGRVRSVTHLTGNIIVFDLIIVRVISLLFVVHADIVCILVIVASSFIIPSSAGVPTIASISFIVLHLIVIFVLLLILVFLIFISFLLEAVLIV